MEGILALHWEPTSDLAFISFPVRGKFKFLKLDKKLVSFTEKKSVSGT